MIDIETLKILEIIEFLQYHLKNGAIAFSELNEENEIEYNSFLVYDDSNGEYTEEDAVKYPIVLDRVIDAQHKDIVSTADDIIGCPIKLYNYGDEVYLAQIKIDDYSIVVSKDTWVIA